MSCLVRRSARIALKKLSNNNPSCRGLTTHKHGGLPRVEIPSSFSTTPVASGTHILRRSSRIASLPTRSYQDFFPRRRMHRSLRNNNVTTTTRGTRRAVAPVVVVAGPAHQGRRRSRRLQGLEPEEEVQHPASESTTSSPPTRVSSSAAAAAADTDDDANDNFIPFDDEDCSAPADTVTAPTVVPVVTATKRVRFNLTSQSTVIVPRSTADCEARILEGFFDVTETGRQYKEFWEDMLMNCARIHLIRLSKVHKQMKIGRNVADELEFDDETITRYERRIPKTKGKAKHESCVYAFVGGIEGELQRYIIRRGVEKSREETEELRRRLDRHIFLFDALIAMVVFPMVVLASLVFCGLI